jgi:hypothetical protein
MLEKALKLAIKRIQWKLQKLCGSFQWITRDSQKKIVSWKVITDELLSIDWYY